ncbi:response regulator transcription factor [Pusillimonas sp. DMV24BSW_D]|uniref:response regulator transcription factor n=1 Tax=Neopusillimonas aestuarii TaxID=2716226 RepID=UPI001408DAAF|nr:response regulator transcription factor [Pusillimonas sp. DMV24BSW_D]QIM49552.1 response regulator transcription factor [Pusillimonas sp. DMV24BSW_D]
MARIMILEPYPLLRLGLVQLLSGLGPDTILHSQGSLTENNAPAEHYDLVLMSLDEKNAGNQIQKVELLFTPNAILLMGEATTMPVEIIKTSSAVAGYIASSSPSEVLQAAVRLVLAGGTCFPRKADVATTVELKPDPIVTAYSPTRWPPAIELSARPPKSRREHEMLGLTPRQYEVLVLLAQGHPMKTIGRKLNISVATAKAHTETLYQRLNVHNRNAAVYAAVSRGAKLGWASLAGNTFDTDMKTKEAQRA